MSWSNQGRPASALIAAALTGVVHAQAAQEWSQSYYNAAHTGYNAKETTLSVSNVAGLQLIWSSTAPSNGVTGFALDGGVIYAQGQGTTTPNLSAIDAASGNTLWTVATGNDGIFLSGTLAAEGNLVIAGCGFADNRGANYGAICGYKKSSGKLIWQWSNPCDCLPESGANAPLVFDKGAVYFGYANGGAGGNEYIEAIDAKTGGELWSYLAGGPNDVGSAALAVGSGLVYFGCGGQNNFNGVCAINQSDGTFAWSYDVGSGALGLTAGTGALYISDGFDGQYVDLDGKNGTPLWSYSCSDCGSENPVSIAHDVLYAPGYGGMVYALKAKTGTLLWSANLADQSALSIANGVIYEDQQGSNNPATAAYNASNGALLWSAPSPGSTLHPPPIVEDGVLYIANAPCGTVCAYGLPGKHR
jgi:outer membrane protein assembly factor BamB